MTQQKLDPMSICTKYFRSFLRRFSCSGIVLIWKFSFKRDLQDLDVAFRTFTVFIIFYATTGFAAFIFLFPYVFEQCFAVFVLSIMKRDFFFFSPKNVRLLQNRSRHVHRPPLV